MILDPPVPTHDDFDRTRYVWPAEGATRIPYWVYTDQAIYEREIERLFAGPLWHYVALEAELPQPGDFKRSFVGDRSIVVARDRAGEVHVFVNRCAHKGAQLCQSPQGSTKTFTCPYHQWSYALNGQLIGVPFRRGIDGKGGFPASFDPAQIRLPALAVARRGGVIFASFARELPSLAAFIGPKILPYFDREFPGRPLEVLGSLTQRVPGNWKLILENLIDPYHTSLLHTFFATFGLFRPDQPAFTVLDELGVHSAQATIRGKKVLNAGTREMTTFRAELELEDPRLLDAVKEFDGESTVIMTGIWPSVILQQQSNTLATRKVVPRGPGAFDLIWTFFGYADDAPELRRRRLFQANLMGPAGYVSMEDGEVIERQQDGFEQYARAAAIVELDAPGTGETDHLVTEGMIRTMYRAWRRLMDL